MYSLSGKESYQPRMPEDIDEGTRLTLEKVWEIRQGACAKLAY